jgi:hypothetical protein
MQQQFMLNFYLPLQGAAIQENYEPKALAFTVISGRFRTPDVPDKEGKIK